MERERERQGSDAWVPELGRVETQLSTLIQSFKANKFLYYII